MYDEIQRHLGTGKKIRLERSLPSNPLLNGYLLGLSETLGLMHCFHDFLPDGFTVFRIADVASIHSGKYERHWDRMLIGEGLLNGLQNPPAIELSTMRAAIESINLQHQRLIVECEDTDEDLEDFYIGTVCSIDDAEVCFDHFDGLGLWEDSASSIPLDEISLLQFETPYIQRFWNYLSGPSPSQREQ